MLFGIGLILLLMVVSGVIAYLGDLIGRRVGKKRISIFGLRPKYTSIVITIATGVMIVSVTIAAVLIVFKQARTAFFGIQKMVTEMKKTEASLVDLQKKYDAEERTYKESIAATTVTLEENRTAMAAKQAELDDILGAINLKAVELTALQDSTNDLQERVTKLSGDVSGLENSKKLLEKKIQDLNREYADTLGDKYHDMLHGEILYRKDQALARVSIPNKAQEKDVENRLLHSVNNVFKEAVSRGALIEDDAAMVFGQQFKSLNEALKNSSEDIVVELRSHTNVLKGQPVYITLTIVDNEVLYRKGQVLEKEIVRPEMTQEEVSVLLSGMLSRTSADAREAGMVPDVQDGQIGSIPARRFIEVLKDLAGSKDAKTVELIAVEDTKLSDRLQVDFKAY